MKISKQLSKILISASFFLFVLSAQAQEVKEIWSEIEKKEINNTQSTNNLGTSGNTDQLEGIKIKLSDENIVCLLYTSPSPRDKRQSRMPSSA